MVVAMGTFHRYSEQSLAKQIVAIRDVHGSVFFLNSAPFFGDFMVSVEGRRQQLLLGRIGH